MAKTWTMGDWDDELHRKADEAVKVHMEKMNMDGYSETKKDAIRNELKKTALKKLKENFKFSNLKDTERDFVSNWKAEDAASFLLSGGNKAYTDTFNPLNIKKQEDFQKLAPFILGVADEGRDWYNMGNVDLFDAGKKLGYDVSTKKGKNDFLRDVGDVQMAYDRGKLLEEFNKENGVLSELFYPTLMEEMRKQISTGTGTQEQLDAAKSLDKKINWAMAMAPFVAKGGEALLAKGGQQVMARAPKVANVVNTASRQYPRSAKVADIILHDPAINGVYGALGQGGLEAYRQAEKENIDSDLEADYKNALLALTMGATRPGMIGSASALASQVPGRPMSRFARGIAGATRKGNPVYMERDEFGNALDLLLGRQKGTTIPKRATLTAKANPLTEGNLDDEYAKVILGGPNAASYTLPEVANARLAEKGLEQLEKLYGTEKARKILNNLISKETVLKDYDNLSKLFINRDKYNAARKLPVGKELVNGELRDDDVLTKLEQAFPSKMAEAYGNDGWYTGGLITGDILGGIGGSVEPVIKVNPFGPLSGGRPNIVSSADYKETAWYKKLSKKQQEAFDDAYEKSKKQAK